MRRQGMRCLQESAVILVTGECAPVSWFESKSYQAPALDVVFLLLFTLPDEDYLFIKPTSCLSFQGALLPVSFIHLSLVRHIHSFIRSFWKVLVTKSSSFVCVIYYHNYPFSTHSLQLRLRIINHHEDSVCPSCGPGFGPCCPCSHCLH